MKTHTLPGCHPAPWLLTIVLSSRAVQETRARRPLGNLRLIIGSVLLLLGWGCNGDPTGPGPTVEPFCSDQPDSAIVAFEDANLEAAIRAELSIGPQDDLTCGLVSGLTTLEAFSAGIESLVGIQDLTNLTFLNLNNNSITHIGPLRWLTNLKTLSLINNSITDISALSGLTSLTLVVLSSNSNLSNIQPLLDNPGLRAHTTVFLTGTDVSCSDVALLKANGVSVFSSC